MEIHGRAAKASVAASLGFALYATGNSLATTSQSPFLRGSNFPKATCNVLAVPRKGQPCTGLYITGSFTPGWEIKELNTSGYAGPARTSRGRGMTFADSYNVGKFTASIEGTYKQGSRVLATLTVTARAPGYKKSLRKYSATFNVLVRGTDARP